MHRRAVAPRLVELGQLFMELVEHLLGVLPIEPHARGARGDLLRLYQRRQRARHRAQKAGLFPALVFLFSRLHPGPDALHIAGRFRRFLAEHVRVAPNEFLIDGVERVLDAEQPLFRAHLRIEDGLQQKVAQLFGEFLPLAPLDGVENLVGLFEGVRLDAIEGLFAVPRAPARSA